MTMDGEPCAGCAGSDKTRLIRRMSVMSEGGETESVGPGAGMMVCDFDRFD
jgi:hypothetical protein